MPVQEGQELQEIETQEIGFLSIAGDAKIRLLPTPWPSDSLPSPTSSLLSVASSKGILAAAGPQGIVIASTDAVRKAYHAETTDDSNTRPFQPQLQIPFPTRISHLAFSAGEDALVVAAQEGGGLAAYDVSTLMQGNTQPSTTISLNGASLRSLVPNPVAPELFAAVTVTGELLMANLKSNQLVQGPTGPVLKTGVSCISWSNKGKQLVAGLGDGTAFQMTPEGQGKAEVPRPPGLVGDQHVSSAVWLENDVFFMVYTPTAVPEDDRPDSSYYIINRSSPDNYTCCKLPPTCNPFGLERYPPFQFTARLRNFEPGLKDVLLVASTASTDIGVFSRSTKPLSNDAPTDVFTATTMSEDSRRAVLPMTEDFTDTSPIGMVLDLSCKDPVPFPIPGDDELKSSEHPLPELLVLNNDGVLSSWWFVYSESVRQQQPYHAIQGGVPAPQQQQQQQQQQQTPQAPIAGRPETPKSAFGQPAFGNPAFGTPSMGAGSKPVFGSPSALGASQSSTPTATSGPAFGAPTPMGGGGKGVSFGTPSMMGQRGPAFGQTSPMGSQKPAFGQPSQPGGFGATAGTPSTGAAAPSGTSAFGGGSGFSSFASGGGFASLGAPKSQGFGGSPLAQTSGSSPFASAGQSISGSKPVESLQADTPAPSEQKATGTSAGFGLGSGGFVLGSSFKPDTTEPTKQEKSNEGDGSLSFGPSLGNLLNETPATSSSPAAPAPAPPTSSPPKSPPKAEPPVQKNPFGLPAQPPAQPPAPEPPQPAPQPQEPPKQTESTTPASSFTQSSPFVNLQGPSTQPSTPPPAPKTEPSLSESTVKVEPPSDTEPRKTKPVKEPEAPLPPEPTSRASYAPGDTSASSSNSKGSYEEAPLPPDFIKAKPKPKPIPDEVEPLPEESDGEVAEFEDSGEDVPNEGHQVRSFTSQESSFGAQTPRRPSGNLFSRASDSEKKGDGQKQLFGEISNNVFPPPKLPEGRRQLTPRSPSPVRNQRASNLAKADGLRSSSAPSAPGKALSQRKATLESSMLAKQVSPPADEPRDEGRIGGTDSLPQRPASPEITEDDEEEQLRADLQRPLSPAPTLDPFLPHQDYTGESLKPGIPGQIELLYRDINSMIDTLGINSRSMSSFMLFQENNKESDYKRWLRTLQRDQASELLDERLLMPEVDKLSQGAEVLEAALQKGQVKDIHAKLEKCHQLILKDVATLRTQCASLRRTIDSHTDGVAIASAPLSVEQSTLQQELRQSFTDVQSKLANLERDLSQLRAIIADTSQPDSKSKSGSAKPTVEAVTSTINTMTNMAEKKSGDIDVLEAQMKKLGVDLSGAAASPPPSASVGYTDHPRFQTPQKKGPRLFPVTPGSRDGVDVGQASAYHTPESAGRLRSSIIGKNPVDDANGTPADQVVPDDAQRRKAKVERRNELTDNVKEALENRKNKHRPLN